VKRLEEDSYVYLLMAAHHIDTFPLAPLPRFFGKKGKTKAHTRPFSFTILGYSEHLVKRKKRKKRYSEHSIQPVGVIKNYYLSQI